MIWTRFFEISVRFPYIVKWNLRSDQVTIYTLMLILIEVFENSVYLDKLAEDIGGRPYGDVDRNAPA